MADTYFWFQWEHELLQYGLRAMSSLGRRQRGQKLTNYRKPSLSKKGRVRPRSIYILEGANL